MTSEITEPTTETHAGEIREHAGDAPFSLLLVRHAQTEHNVNGVYQGWSDSAVTPTGHEQIVLVGSRLADAPILGLRSSDLPRTMTTAAGIAELHDGLTIEPDERLREWHFGDHEELPAGHVMRMFAAAQGLTDEATEDDIREVAARFTSDEVFDAIAALDPSGRSERIADARYRIRSGLVDAVQHAARLVAAGDGGALVIVSHGGIIPTMVAQLVDDVPARSLIANCSVTRVDYDGERFSLVELGTAPGDFGY